MRRHSGSRFFFSQVAKPTSPPWRISWCWWCWKVTAVLSGWWISWQLNNLACQRGLFHQTHQTQQWSIKIKTLLQSAEWVPGVWPIWSHRLSDNHVGDQCWDVHRDNQHQDDLQVGRWSLWAIGGHQQWLSARWRSSFLFFVSFLSHFFVLGGYRQR